MKRSLSLLGSGLAGADPSMALAVVGASALFMVCAIVGASASAVVISTAGATVPRVAQGNALQPVVVVPSSVDFGVVTPGSTQEAQFVLQNRSASSVRVAKVTPSCKCTAISLTEGTQI
ncbi:MAG: DUF1573 domain-containing protein, partial [Phycisphaerales bacterium]|nr:DUF1573 domain-containing protein [Phycisphaerales bacterium]